MSSRSKVSRGYLAVVPKSVREASKIREGDTLEWAVEGDKIVVRPRKRITVDDITGLVSGSGDAVESKSHVQDGSSAGG